MAWPTLASRTAKEQEQNLRHYHAHSTRRTPPLPRRNSLQLTKSQWKPTTTAINQYSLKTNPNPNLTLNLNRNRNTNSHLNNRCLNPCPNH